MVTPFGRFRFPGSVPKGAFRWFVVQFLVNLPAQQTAAAAVIPPSAA